MKKIFYVYELYDPRGKVFYVGKGSGDRWKRIPRCQGSNRRDPARMRVRELRERGDEVGSRKVFETTDEEAAYAEEVRLIAHYGVENLCNTSTGGRGAKGTPRSEDTRKKLSDALKKYQITPEHRANMSKGGRGKVLSPQHCKQISDRQRGKVRGPMPEEQARRMSATAIANNAAKREAAGLPPVKRTNRRKWQP